MEKEWWQQSSPWQEAAADHAGSIPVAPPPPQANLDLSQTKPCLGWQAPQHTYRNSEAASALTPWSLGFGIFSLPPLFPFEVVLPILGGKGWFQEGFCSLRTMWNSVRHLCCGFSGFGANFFFSLRREKPPIPVIRAEKLGSAGRPCSTQRGTADKVLTFPLPSWNLA